MGLESIHPEVLPKLNKQLTPNDFRETTAFLRANDIDTRAFILLKPTLSDRQKRKHRMGPKNSTICF